MTRIMMAIFLLPWLALASPQTVHTAAPIDATARSSAAAAAAAAAVADGKAVAADAKASVAEAFALNVFTAVLSANPEVDPGSTRNIGIQVNDRNGDPVAFNVDVLCEVRSSGMQQELTADFTIEEIATGLPIYPAGAPWQSTALIRTSATGAAAIQIAEVATGSEGAKTVVVVCRVVGAHGGTSYVELAFDADNA